MVEVTQVEPGLGQQAVEEAGPVLTFITGSGFARVAL
jgi:hypothetical protein